MFGFYALWVRVIANSQLAGPVAGLPLPAMNEASNLVIGLDFDDTLWHTTPHFERGRQIAQDLMSGAVSPEVASSIAARSEWDRIRVYGYGWQSFVLACLDSAVGTAADALPLSHFAPLFEWAHYLRTAPVALLDGVADVVGQLVEQYRVIGITRGSFLQQQDLFLRSGLGSLFSEVEVVWEKSPETYRSVLRRHGVHPSSFVMIGDSEYADVVPPISIGATAIHIPYPHTWNIEAALDTGMKADARMSGRWYTADTMLDVPRILAEFGPPHTRHSSTRHG